MRRKSYVFLFSVIVTLSTLASCNAKEDTYTITWKNYDGSILEIDNDVKQGSFPSYDSLTPSRESDKQYTYTFNGWSPELTEVKEDKTYTAQFTSSVNSYTITWNVNGNISTESYEYGEMPTYKNGTPSKQADEQYSYTFTRWSPEISEVNEDKTYTAEFSSSLIYKKIEIEGSDTKVGQSFKILGKTQRGIPLENSEESSISQYPVYGYSIQNISSDTREKLYNESYNLSLSNIVMDSEGYLSQIVTYGGSTYYSGKGTLYKHPTAANNYYGCPSDEEDAVIKEITIEPRAIGNHITGLYAPAGEIIKIEISEEDLKNTGGLTIQMGQYTQTNELNRIDKTRTDICRMNFMGNEMVVDSTTSYVGSFYGGPIYVTPNKTTSTFTVKISGAIEYAHFIYGVTTREDFERVKNSSAPYFDFEVWDKSVRHSGPKKYANLDYDNLVKIAKFWQNVSNISTQVPYDTKEEIGITFLYDPFIASGAAVAMVTERNWCNLPPSWMSGALNYETFVTSGGWGVIHEYNHHYQAFGFNDNTYDSYHDEVTNNAMTILSYINYTEISKDRTSLGTGWNRFLDPSTSFKETLSKAGEKNSSLSTYVDIIHAFGVDTFLRAAKNAKGSRGVDIWYDALSEATDYNMDFYFELIGQDASESIKQKHQNKDTFVPITLKEQTGRLINNKEIITVLPYPVEVNKEYKIDLDTSLTLPSGFTYKLVSVTSPSKGNLTQEGNVLTYKSSETGNSGQIKLTVEITKENEISRQETIIFELNNKYFNTLEKTTYTYDSNKYNSIEEAENANFAGYVSVNSSNVSTNMVNGISNYQICTYKGKVYMPSAGNYNISVRTSNRNNTKLKLGLNSSSYTETIDSPRSSPINYNSTYKTFNVKKGDFIYYEITIQSYHNDGFAELFGSYDTNLTSISYNYLYSQNVELDVIKDNFEDKYPKTYKENIKETISNSNATIYSYTESFSSWDTSTQPIEKIIDGDVTTSYHSVKDKFITTEPFEVTVDLGSSKLVNTLTFLGYNRNSNQNPTSLELYGGNNPDNLVLLNSYSSISFSNREASLTFEATNLRYYKIKINDTVSHRYVAISELTMSYEISANLLSPSNAEYFVSYGESFTKEYIQSHFGYVVKGNGLVKINTSSDFFGIKVKEDSVKIKLTINGESKIVEFDKLYYENLSSNNNNIEIEVLEGEISIEGFLLG